ncbi:MAG: class I SAM-dependent methyltransferase [Bryobacteraceae bacterium]
MIRPIQVFSEILALLEYVAPLRPRRILEIGTASGGTLFLFCRIAAPDASVISVDLPDGELSYPPWKAELYHAFKLPGQSIHLLRADSHDVRTLSNVKGLLEDSKLDLLFIDGDHSYMGVKQDFEMYAPLAGERGIVALHDIVPIQPRQAWCEVDRFWIELRDRYPYREFVEDWRQGWGGIGMLTRTAPAQ